MRRCQGSMKSKLEEQPVYVVFTELCRQAHCFVRRSRNEETLKIVTLFKTSRI